MLKYRKHRMFKSLNIFKGGGGGGVRFFSPKYAMK